MPVRLKTALLAALAASVATSALAAEEFTIGAQVAKNNLLIVPHYLTGIEMAPMPLGMAMGPDAVHLEADVHAAKGEQHGFAEGSWMPYLTITYTLTKEGTPFKATGALLPMTAGDGPHYANNVKLAGPGQYRLTYHFEPPSKVGFIRHVDKASGVPDWWKPFDAGWSFTYPIEKKAE